jgi:hypothetical protein
VSFEAIHEQPVVVMRLVTVSVFVGLQRFFVATTRELGPSGSFSSKFVGGGFKARVGDPFLDLGLAVEHDRHAVALQDDLEVGEGFAAVGDQVGRALKRDGELGCAGGRAADV